MTDINCESIRISAMALADGEESPLDREEIDTHLRNCDRCRAEIEQLRAINELLSSQKRLRSEANLWRQVSERLEVTAGTMPSFSWRLLLLFGIPLFGYKALLLSVHAAPSLWSKLVPIILVIAVFSYLKTNPFKINCELTR
ncbi:MAG TPA: zf-HC2 domain-containing protein [Pyrinomonadaceae bacterium]|nr:zf-HC2 domain-containing protein [Pyrinomonadaceae bacterium]